jgi:hypothetical protein
MMKNGGAAGMPSQPIRPHTVECSLPSTVINDLRSVIESISATDSASPVTPAASRADMSMHAL